MMLAKFYKYSQYPWFIRLLMIVGYLDCWVALVFSVLLALVIPSMPGYKAVLLSAMFGGYVFILFKMRKQLVIEPEDMVTIKVDEGTTDIFKESIGKLL